MPLPLLGSGTLVHCFSQFLSLTSEMTFLIFLKKIYRFIYLIYGFLAVQGPSPVGGRGYSLVVVLGLFIAVASLVLEHRL